ncbi:MAG: saccharopine dehydrogenase NADP-binding domain-containing protein [Gammaproteobacteria bacterium]|nr:saccharopine dehydrogenase NADP-binding domain-containing protein [Gammaproteobacteria bacterium]
MHKTFIAGAGTIGTLIAALLVNSGGYEVYLVDNNLSHLSLPPYKNLHLHQLDVKDSEQLKQYLLDNEIEITISSLPYFHNMFIANAAAELNLNYFDLTEDINVAAEVRRLAHNKAAAFVPQCGIAPGFINIVANHLMTRFDKIQATYLRAGCLPKSSHNALQYAITWSLDGLINEYGNTCYGLVNGEKVALQPLDDLELVELDGTLYEAFNTSGGVGSLNETYQGKVQTLNYKTLRYPGHCEKMRFLMKDLQLNEDRPTLRRILEKSLPRTDQDVMLLYVSVTGEKEGSYYEQSYVKKIEPMVLHERKWTAIQISTASSLCAVVDLVMDNPEDYRGFILQEQFALEKFLNNRFGQIFNL